MNNILYLSIIIKIIIVITLIVIIYKMNNNPIEKFTINCSNIDIPKKQSLATSCNEYINAVKYLNKLINIFRKRNISLQKYNNYIKKDTITGIITTALDNINNLKTSFILSNDLNLLNNIMDCIIISYKIKYIKTYITENKDNLIILYNSKVKNIKELYEINADFTEIQALDDALQLYVLTISKNKLFNIYKIPNQYSIDNLTTIKSLLQSDYTKLEIDKNTLKNTYNTSIDKIPELLPLNDYYTFSDIIRAILYCQKLYDNSLKPLQIYKFIAYNEALNMSRYIYRMETTVHIKLLNYCRELIGNSAIKPPGFYSRSGGTNIPPVPILPPNISNNDRSLNCINNNYSRVTLVAELNRLHRLIIFIQEDSNLLNRMTILSQNLVNKNNVYHSINFIVNPSLNSSAENYLHNLKYRVGEYNKQIIKYDCYEPSIKKESDNTFNLFIGTLQDYIDFFNDLYNNIIEYNKEPDKIEFDKLIDEYDTLYNDYMSKLSSYNRCY